MRKLSATAAARSFGKVLRLVAKGESLQVVKHGRTVARVIPEAQCMPGRQAARIFRNHKPDPEAAVAIERELAKIG